MIDKDTEAERDSTASPQGGKKKGQRREGRRGRRERRGGRKREGGREVRISTTSAENAGMAEMGEPALRKFPVFLEEIPG